MIQLSQSTHQRGNPLCAVFASKKSWPTWQPAVDAALCMAQLPGHSAQPSMARDVYGSLLRIGIVFVSLRRLSGDVRWGSPSELERCQFQMVCFISARAPSIPCQVLLKSETQAMEQQRWASPKMTWGFTPWIWMITGAENGSLYRIVALWVTAFLVPVATKICHGNMFTTFVSYVGLTTCYMSSSAFEPGIWRSLLPNGQWPAQRKSKQKWRLARLQWVYRFIESWGHGKFGAVPMWLITKLHSFLLAYRIPEWSHNALKFNKSLGRLLAFHLFSFSSVVLLTGDFVLQAVLAESHPHFNGFPDAVGLLWNTVVW